MKSRLHTDPFDSSDGFDFSVGFGDILYVTPSSDNDSRFASAPSESPGDDNFPIAAQTMVSTEQSGSGKAVGSISQLANYLLSGFWQFNNTISHHWATHTITYNINGLNANEQALAQSALNAWHEVANVTFVQTSGNANITFNHNGSMQAFETDQYTNTGAMISSTVDISADWVTNDGGAMDGKTGIDSYAYQTYIHEIGHALGLGHQGPYNGSATYSTDALYANDTWQYSVMSYFSENNFNGSTYRYVITPQMADIYAVISVYGAAQTRTGDTTYGFNSNAGSIYNFSTYSSAPALTIYDTGGNDTLDCSRYAMAQTIDLRDGHFSSIGGLINNIGIATGCVIENAIGGSGNDILDGNSANNVLSGGGGADTYTFTGDGWGIDWIIDPDHTGTIIFTNVSNPLTLAGQFIGSISGNDFLLLDRANGSEITLQGVGSASGWTFGYTSTDFTVPSNAWAPLSWQTLETAIAPVPNGTTNLVQIGNNYFFITGGSGVTPPEFQYNGAPFYTGEFGGWTLIGAVQVSGGYDVAWKFITGVYAVSSVDSNGNYINDIFSGVAANSTILEQYETIFNQDLNGDGTVGLTTTVIHSDGTTSLVQVGANYFLNPVSGGTGPELKYNGAPLYSGEFGSWTLIGAVHVSGGYDIAWKFPTGVYAVSSVDSNGTYISDIFSGAAANSTVLGQYETIFNQDLNGDGTVGLPTILVHNDGTTSLLQIGNNYFFNAVGSGVTGPEFNYNGAPFYTGEFGGWTLIGAVQVSGGYDVAWKFPTGVYAVSSVDSNGNYINDIFSGAAANSTILEQYETIFNQDLNGDGTVGLTTTVIHSDGTTSLVQVGANYFLNPVSGGTGPELKYNGAPLYSGEFGSWTLIGAVHVSGGYDIAWKFPTGVYAVSSVDSNGTYISDIFSGAAANSTVLGQYETIFNQDLNGDGTVGLPTILVHNDGTTSLLQIGNNYFFNAVGSGVTGPEFNYNGAPVYTGEFGSWTLIGAVHVSGGYEVAWKFPTGVYAVSSVDDNGNYINDIFSGVAANSAILEQYETIFNQDLNGDGTVGAPSVAALNSPRADPVLARPYSFDGKILSLAPSMLSGPIIGFRGDGTVGGSDQIDLKGINSNSLHSSFDSTTGVLIVDDGTTSAKIEILGQHSLENFHFADDGFGGTTVYTSGPPSLSGQPVVVTMSGHDGFVFNPNFGQLIIANFYAVSDNIYFGKSVFADIDALIAATHDDLSGNAVITNDLHDTITIQHTTTAQLLTQPSNFHFF